MLSQSIPDHSPCPRWEFWLKCPTPEPQVWPKRWKFLLFICWMFCLCITANVWGLLHLFCAFISCSAPAPFVIHGNPEISQTPTLYFQPVFISRGLFLPHPSSLKCLFSFFLVSSRPFLRFIKTISTPNPGLRSTCSLSQTGIRSNFSKKKK